MLGRGSRGGEAGDGDGGIAWSTKRPRKRKKRVAAGLPRPEP